MLSKPLVFKENCNVEWISSWFWIPKGLSLAGLQSNNTFIDCGLNSNQVRLKVMTDDDRIFTLIVVKI